MSARAMLKLLGLTVAYGLLQFLQLTLGTRRRALIATLVALGTTSVLLSMRGPAENATGAPELRVRYDGLAAVSVIPRSDVELKLVIDMSADVWSEQLQVDHPLVVLLSSESIARLADQNVSHRVLIDDVQSIADAERARLSNRVHADESTSWFAEYRDVQEISDRMDQMVESSTMASSRRLGTSLEGWPIRSIDIGRGGKTAIVLSGGIHAREWISPMVNMCIADRLLTQGDSDPRIRAILDAASFHIAPLANPDGYVHSWNVDRYWRKNRRGGYGVDLNRNFGVAWGQKGASRSRYSQTYRGTHAFSEPETEAMRALFEGKKIAAHIDFHSFSQLILYPWNHKTTESPDAAKFAAVADRMSSAMYAQHEEPYKVIAGANFYAASGTFSDWSYGAAGALGYTIELRPGRGGRSGFVLPPEQIVATCDESMAAVLELAEWMIRDAEQATP